MTDPRQMNEAERTAFDAAMAEGQPLQKARHTIIIEQKIEASATIAMLERRTRTQTIDLELEGGDKIQIYSRMSESTLRGIDAIEDERSTYLIEAGKNMDLLKNGHFEDPDAIRRVQEETESLFNRAGDCWLKVIAIVTVDPEITFEWLKANPDKYSSEDIADAYLAYKETRKQQIAERAERVSRAINFRKKPAGPGIHTAPSLDENKGSEGMGGTPGGS